LETIIVLISHFELALLIFVYSLAIASISFSTD
jgi:hypothetical protein